MIAKNAQECDDIWRVREDSFLIEKRYPGGCWYDISVPLAALDAFVRRRHARVQHIQTRSRQFGWLGHFRTSAGCSARNFAIRHFAGGYLRRMVLPKVPRALEKGGESNDRR